MSKSLLPGNLRETCVLGHFFILVCVKNIEKLKARQNRKLEVVMKYLI